MKNRTENIEKLIEKCEKKCENIFSKIDEIALFNQEKVLNAFQENRVASRHFSPSTGYGYGDEGRDVLRKVFSNIFGAEDALVSPLITSGTHAINLAVSGVLKSGDTFLLITGKPYDTLVPSFEKLKEFGIKQECIELKDDGSIDGENVKKSLLQNKPKLVFIQRSRGYTERDSLSIDEIKDACSIVKKNSSAIIFADNCYGEFCDKVEPTEVGVDIAAGSLIKNAGGGIAPTGGYIVGKKELIEQVADRHIASGIGMEVGSYNAPYLPFYQGLFLAPHSTAQALKASVLFGCAFEEFGQKTLPNISKIPADIIRSIRFNSADELISFVQNIQKNSPIDAHVTPHPWDMPGYAHQVIMAAGTFIQGATSELSADSPIKEPYIAYLQGALTYEHAKIALKNILKNVYA
ncbi:MAG: methionine gamma-lyase family protein [Firmicutes bacterium]|nr:methionine gamma-lyase family protein [Bacillota bacterium]MCL2255783.1 methionine gamma-lyase family protein [Bacillota bacterium]